MVARQRYASIIQGISLPDAERWFAQLSDRYVIDREIGAGGMAMVYLARDQRHDRLVAVKLLRPELAAVIGAARFLQEIRTTANLQHPHILPLHDSGEIDGTVFYVMPYVDGESLRARLDRDKQLPIDEAVRITTEVAGALDYAHRHGVIHRDIKPENILLHDGTALVADFGIALALSTGDSRMTETGMSLGTPAYMSPEQAMGERSLTGRSDVYALGCVLYEMLVGEPPFTGPTAQAIVAKVITDEPRGPRSVRKSVPPAVEHALLKALEKLPADRWATAGEFAAALTHPQGMGHDAVPARARGQRTLLAAAVVAGIVIGAVAAWMLAGTRSNATSTAEPRRWSITLPDSAPFVAARDYYGLAQRSLALSPDGGRLVYSTGTPTGTRLVMLHLDAGSLVALRGSDNGRLPTFSPDGKFVAFVVADTEIRRLSLDDGSSIHVASVTDPFALFWLGDRLYYTDVACAASVSPAGGETRFVGGTCADQTFNESMAPIASRTDWFLYDGSAQGIVATHNDVRLLSATTRERRQLVAGEWPHFVPPGYLVFMRDSTLMASRFDAASLQLRGQPVPVIDGIRQEESGHPHLDVAGDGTIVWAPGGVEAMARFVWVTANGRIQDTAFMPPMVVASYALAPDSRRVAIERQTSDRRTELVIADLERRVLDPIPYSLNIEPQDWIRGGRGLTVRVIRKDGTTRGGLVTFDARGTASVDTVTWGFVNESPSGALRCRMNTIANSPMVADSTSALMMWRSSGAADSIRVDARGGWCRFSPDERHLVWANPDGIFVASTDPKAPRARVKLAPPGADEPRWSWDGRSIIYRSATRWYQVSAPTADLKPAGAPKELFSGYYQQAWVSWDLGRDGRFLLVQGQAPVRLTHLNVMTNFPKYLELKVK